MARREESVDFIAIDLCLRPLNLVLILIELKMGKRSEAKNKKRTVEIIKYDIVRYF